MTAVRLVAAPPESHPGELETSRLADDLLCSMQCYLTAVRELRQSSYPGLESAPVVTKQSASPVGQHGPRTRRVLRWDSLDGCVLRRQYSGVVAGGRATARRFGGAKNSACCLQRVLLVPQTKDGCEYMAKRPSWSAERERMRAQRTRTRAESQEQRADCRSSRAVGLWVSWWGNVWPKHASFPSSSPAFNGTCSMCSDCRSAVVFDVHGQLSQL